MITKKIFFILLFAITSILSQTYFPDYGNWKRKKPNQVGFNQKKLNKAIQYAIDSESSGSGNLTEFIKATLTKEPHGEIIGPTKDSGDMTGLIIKNGFIV